MTLSFVSGDGGMDYSDDATTAYAALVHLQAEDLEDLECDLPLGLGTITLDLRDINLLNIHDGLDGLDFPTDQGQIDAGTASGMTSGRQAILFAAKMTTQGLDAIGQEDLEDEDFMLEGEATTATVLLAGGQLQMAYSDSDSVVFENDDVGGTGIGIVMTGMTGSISFNE